MLFNIQNLDLLAVGIAIASIGILGFAVYNNNKSSLTNKTFAFFAVMTILYGVFNYISYKIESPIWILWLVRFTIFLAVWHAFSIFEFFYVFPKEKFKFTQKFKFFLLPLVIFTSILTLTPLVFSGVNEAISQGQASRPLPGPAIGLFGLVVLFLIIGGVINIAKKTKEAQPDQKEQFLFIFIGTIITFSLIITFNFILPTVFNNSTFVPLAPVFILPFIIFTSYSIIRYHLLNIKVIATEFLIFSLAIANLFEIIISPTTNTAIFRIVTFCLVLILGILLVKSVRKEVEQREQLEILSKELANANDQLKVLDQARAEFISIASHQLRTPPATVKWYLSAILSGDYGKLDPEVQEVLKKTERTNNSLISLIEDLLNVSRIERGKMEFLFEPTNLLELAEITFEQLEPIAKEKKLNLIFDKPKTFLPEITADKEKLRQVMNNMIDNALKYTKQGSIKVELFLEDENIRFQVTDSGKGISPEDASKIFEKFSRGKESIKQSAGLGLGLYVAKVIIEQHKGRIWAESKGPGLGSTFAFTLPVKNNLSKTTLLDLTLNQTV